MSNDLISRSALLEQMHNHYEVRNPKQNATMDECCMMVIHAPAVNAETYLEQLELVKEAFEMAKSNLAPVVRCKDCKWLCSGFGAYSCTKHTGLALIKPDGSDFCSYGKRRDDDGKELE